MSTESSRRTRYERGGGRSCEIEVPDIQMGSAWRTASNNQSASCYSGPGQRVGTNFVVKSRFEVEELSAYVDQ